MTGGSYYQSVTAPTATEGFFVEPETRVLLGTSNMYGSLEQSTWTYLTYGASIGLKAGESVDLGVLESLSFTHVPTFTPVESANIQTSNIFVLEGEETTVSIGLREFRPDIMQMAIGTGVLYWLNSNKEALITFGGKCDMITRPMSLEFSNVQCQVPQAATLVNGVTGGVVTLYDVFATSGLPWDAMDAKAINNITMEFKARPVTALARGNRIGNLYFF